jgi:hypothetical protein
MSYYATIDDDIARAREIIRERMLWHKSGYMDTYRLLKSFIEEIEQLRYENKELRARCANVE